MALEEGALAETLPANETIPARGGLRRGKVVLGLALFAGLAALGAFTAGWLDEGTPLTFLGLVRAMPAHLVLVAALLMAADYVMGGLRLHFWLRRLDPGATFGTALKAYLVTLFAGPVSPASAASAPTQLATLVRCGVHPARAFAAMLLNYVGILSALLIVGALGGFYLVSATELADRLGGFERSLLTAGIVIPLVFVVAILNPKLAGALARASRTLANKNHNWIGRLLRKFGDKLGKAVDEYRDALAAVRADWKRPLAGSLTISVAMLINKCAVALTVAVALGYGGGFVDVAAPHALQQLFLYFSPTPGGSGVAEASVPVFLSGVVPDGRAAEFAILWRVFTSYIGIVVGAVAVVLVFARRQRQP